MFAVIVELEIRASQMDAFLPLLKENARTSLREEPGCRQFDICLPDGAGQSDVIWLYELYDDAAAFQSHLKSAHFLAFDAAVAEMVSDKRVVTAARHDAD